LPVAPLTNANALVAVTVGVRSLNLSMTTSGALLICVGAPGSRSPDRSCTYLNYLSRRKELAMLDHTHATARSITKTVRIACDRQAAFEFLADLGNWPHWPRR
jgi:hypothetical protein